MAKIKRATSKPKGSMKGRAGTAKAKARTGGLQPKRRRESVPSWQKNAAVLLRDLWTDPEFKAEFLSNPEDGMRNAGLDLPKDIRVKVVEDTPDTIHLVIPRKPANIRIEDIGKDLEAFKLSRSTNCFTGHTKKSS